MDIFLDYFDQISLFLGRIVLTLFFIGLFFCLIFLYCYFFKTPYCPKCHSRKKAMAAGNTAGGYHCGRCHTYYWYKKGKSYTRK